MHEETCAKACSAQVGCTECVPGEGTCEGESERVCKDDGSGFELRECDPVQGTHCDASIGRCAGACSSQALGKSYIGCEYFPTPTANGFKGDFEFGVIVSNTGNATASVRLEGSTLTSPLTFTVAPGGVAVQRLAYDPVLRFCNSSIWGSWCQFPAPYGAYKDGGAFRLRSDQPVTVYQFSPLDYINADGLKSYSNDASLLLPTTSLRGEYVAASWQTWRTPDGYDYPGIVAITATRDNTKVQITTSADAYPGGYRPGVTETVTFDRGDVIELASSGETADLTGTRIKADAPVQVIGGHFCTFIPHDVASCDHLEESILPVDALGMRVAVAGPQGLGDRAPTTTRVVGIEADTKLTFEPPIPHAPSAIGAGQHVDIEDPGFDFVVTGTKRINVVQYMLGAAVVGTGDPSMSQAVPTEQWRTRYLFHAPVNYEANYVTIVAPASATITLDGAVVEGWVAIGQSGLRVARVELGGSSGNHDITGTERFGITVYGYGIDTSYWYPGGLDVETILIL